MSVFRVKYLVLLLALIFLILFVREIDPALCWQQLKQVGWGMIPILGATFLAYLSASIAWQICYRGDLGLQLFKRTSLFFVIRQIGESLATINPTGVVGGDALKYVLMTSHGMDKEKSILSLSLLRVLTIFSFLFLVLICVLFLIFKTDILYNPAYLIAACIMITLFAVFVTSMLFSRKLLLHKYALRIFKIFRLSSEHKILGWIQAFNVTTSKVLFLKPKIIIIAFVILMIHWLFGAFEFLLILHYLGYNISLFDAYILEIGTALTRSVMSFIPGQIGVEEYSNKIFLELVGVKGEGIWVSVSIIKRLRQLFWIGLGILLYFKNYRKNNFSGKSDQFVKNGSLIHQS